MKRRSLLVVAGGLVLYLGMGLRIAGVAPVEPERGTAGGCPTSDSMIPGTSAGITILQGNAWMLPSRPLLLPYLFSTDRRTRLQRLTRILKSCRPDAVMLQEMFDMTLVRALARSVPEYQVVTSGQTALVGMVNSSGLVTLSRLPVLDSSFRPFQWLPPNAKAIERLGGKGFLSVEVATSAGAETLVNLHLYAGRDTREETVAIRQLVEVLTSVLQEEREGHPLLAVSGDFNLDPGSVGTLVPEGWTVSQHGPTYDPPGNPYTVQGSNNTPGNHEDRRLGRGVKTVDLLLNPRPETFRLQSVVLSDPILSDHYYVLHRLEPATDPESNLAKETRPPPSDPRKVGSEGIG